MKFAIAIGRTEWLRIPSSARFRMIPSLTAVALSGLAHSGWRLLHD
jgi:hypothetical protein